jgi:hypothetical protein
MVYELGGANLIQGVDVASALHFVDEAAHRVLFSSVDTASSPSSWEGELVAT